MRLLTVDETASFLKLAKRSIYRLKDLPRVHIGGSVRFVEEELEDWVRAQSTLGRKRHRRASNSQLDQPARKVVHRNALFVVPRARAEP